MYYKAINYWVLGGFGGDKSPQQAIDDTVRLGLDGLELTFGDAVKTNISRQECADIRAYAKERKIGLRTMASGAYWNMSLGSPDRVERQKAMDFTRAYLETAAAIGAGTILVVPGAVDVGWDSGRPVVPYADVWRISTMSIKSILPLAKKLKVDIALENVWNKFLLSPMEMKFFVDQFKSSSVGVYLDIANMLVNGYPEHWLDILGRRVKAIHIKNFSRSDAGGGLHGFGDSLKTGDANFPAIKAALRRIRYRGALTVEMIPFCRLPDLVLPDMPLAEKVAGEFREIFN